MVPPDSALSSPDYSTSVQRLIDEWHEQDDLHAAIMGPEILTIQAGRFDYQHAGRRAGAIKRRFRVHPENYVMLPVFREQLHVEHVRYQLRAVLVHWGAAPDTGHYTALLYEVHDGCTFHADDNVSAVLISDQEASRMYCDSCLFYYVKCQ